MPTAMVPDFHLLIFPNLWYDRGLQLVPFTWLGRLN
jgi:hypothetical protein